MTKWPRQYYAEIRDLPACEQDCALQALPERLRAWVALYLSMPESDFALMKKAARIARTRDRKKRRLMLQAITDPKSRERVRAQATKLFFQERRC